PHPERLGVLRPQLAPPGQVLFGRGRVVPAHLPRGQGDGDRQVVPVPLQGLPQQRLGLGEPAGFGQGQPLVPPGGGPLPPPAEHRGRDRRQHGHGQEHPPPPPRRRGRCDRFVPSPLGHGCPFPTCRPAPLPPERHARRLGPPRGL